MRVGVSLRSNYLVDDPRVGARWMIERARAARDAGLDSLFVGDHHATGPFPYYQNVPMIARLLAEWDATRTAGVLMLLPLWNPVLAAEHIGTLTTLHDGPFVLQCAVGGGDEQFAAMGVSPRTRGQNFEASLGIVRRLLAGEAVTETTPVSVLNARIAPIPREPVEMWIGAAAPAAIDRAARLGDAFLCGPEATPSEARRLIDAYRERCEHHGRTPTRIAIRRDIHVGADTADTARVAGPIVAAGYRGFDANALVVGSAEPVAAAFAELAAMGYTDVIVRHLAEDHSEVLLSFERLQSVIRALA